MKRLTVFDGEFWIHKDFPPVREDTVDEFVDCVKDMASRLASIENILGDEYDLDRLRELIEADKDGRTIVLPAQIGESLWHITTCKGFSKVLDGTMYDANGEIGTATGCYCPCELAENCPFLLEEDGSFDCEKYKNIMAIYEDVVTDIVINDMESYMRLDYSGCVDFDDVGKTVFLTREEAESALEKMKEGDK